MNPPMHDRAELEAGLHLLRGEAMPTDAPPGVAIEDMPIWRIRKLTMGYADLTPETVLWANGDDSFTHVWSARLSYPYR